MSETVTFKSLPADEGWKVTRNEIFVCKYPNQQMAERAMARHARAEAKRGNRAKAVLHRKDGSVASERSYTRLTTPWLGNR